MGNSKVDSLARGLVAGLVATVVLSLLILLKQAFGLMPGLNLVMILAHALGYSSSAAGWVRTATSHDPSASCRASSATSSGTCANASRNRGTSGASSARP